MRYLIERHLREQRMIDMAKVTQMLDTGWQVRLFRSKLGSYTAIAMHHDQRVMSRLRKKNTGLIEFVDDHGEVVTDDFTPEKCLTRMAYKVHGEIISDLCQCKDEPGALDQRKISRILGSTMTCLRCGKTKK